MGIRGTSAGPREAMAMKRWPTVLDPFWVVVICSNYLPGLSWPQIFGSSQSRFWYLFYMWSDFCWTVKIKEQLLVHDFEERLESWIGMHCQTVSLWNELQTNKALQSPYHMDKHLNWSQSLKLKRLKAQFPLLAPTGLGGAPHIQIHTVVRKWIVIHMTWGQWQSTFVEPLPMQNGSPNLNTTTQMCLFRPVSSLNQHSRLIEEEKFAQNDAHQNPKETWMVQSLKALCFSRRRLVIHLCTKEKAYGNCW